MNAISELKEKYNEGILSQCEWLLIAIAGLCFGLFLGMILSPKGDRNYGSNNGNDNGNNNAIEKNKSQKG